MGTYATMIGRRCQFGCRCCWPSPQGSGKARKVARRTAKRRERNAWRKEV